jgi:Na+-transporting NADH:ubiquinone oxidoreductase subunit NqrB
MLKKMMQKTMTYPIISITDTMRIYNYFHPKMKKKKSASREPANLDSIKKMLILVLSFFNNMYCGLYRMRRHSCASI